MDWESYRKLLGIEFDDNQRSLKCINIIFNELEDYCDKVQSRYFEDIRIICDNDYKKFCNLLGIRKRDCDYNCMAAYNYVENELTNRKHSLKEFVACFISLVNSISSKSYLDKKELIKIVEKGFNDSGIRFEVLESENNYFLIPNGAKELDDSLVVEPLIWLKDYKETHKLFLHTLSQYSKKEEPRDVADNLRKTLEQFLQEFFNNTKILDKNISEVGKFFDEKGVHFELKNIFTSLMTGYDKANNGIAKHHDNTDENMLEFLLYQTGIFIRTIISLNKS